MDGPSGLLACTEPFEHTARVAPAGDAASALANASVREGAAVGNNS